MQPVDTSSLRLPLMILDHLRLWPPIYSATFSFELQYHLRKVIRILEVDLRILGANSRIIGSVPMVMIAHPPAAAARSAPSARSLSLPTTSSRSCSRGTSSPAITCTHGLVEVQLNDQGTNLQMVWIVIMLEGVAVMDSPAIGLAPWCTTPHLIILLAVLTNSKLVEGIPIKMTGAPHHQFPEVRTAHNLNPKLKYTFIYK